MFKFFDRLFDSNNKTIANLSARIGQISALESSFSKLKPDEFAPTIEAIRKKLNTGSSLDDVLPEVFALTREASVRTLGLRPYDVQLMAAMVFHQGNIAEQKTGEGKTLSAVPAVVLNAITGKGVHVVTVNDYLAQRDAGWMGPIYHLLGLKVAVIFSGKGDLPAAIYDPEYINPNHSDNRLKHLKPISRPEAYQADVTYGTNNEFGFDYLRDNMVRDIKQLSQREHHFAIVDEVDSILIDEARTPLIISSPDNEATDKYFQFANLIKSLSPDTDYEVDEKLGSANLTDHGLRKVEKILSIDNLYEQDYSTLHHIEQALKARTLFIKDRDYIIKDGQIIIVDEHTGRLMYGRRYSDGLHQAIEAKEDVEIQQESRTLATISLQNYFRMYEKLAGMTGTAATESEEFKKIYNLDVVIIPTNKPNIRQDYPDVIYKTQRAKYSAIVAEVAEKYQQGQPVLIGTKSIEQNDIISQYLKKKKIPHQVLNAKNHELEAEIIAQAGRKKAITVATNIAGRGVDIVLGGDPEGREKSTWRQENKDVISSGGLHIIGAVRHESRRIDNQLRGRGGRQGDPGSSRFYISLEDDIMRIFGGDQVSRLMDLLKVPEDQPLEAGMVSKAIETAQKKVESFHFDQRKHVVEYDDVMNKQREIFYKRRFIALTQSTSEVGVGTIVDEALQKEANSLALTYSAAGIDDEEAKRIVQEFQLILPLDPVSAKKITGQLIGANQEEAQELLQKIISSARENQRKIIGHEALSSLENWVVLNTYDELWMDHLDAIENLRDGVRLRGYAQRDPLVEYKQEAFNLFESLLSRIDAQISKTIFRVQIVNSPPPSQLDKLSSKSDQKPLQSLGRNDPCWCGSGKKWKKCHYPRLS